ncbi:MAG: acetylxylan esterase [Planctomycetes bacterium]|nr:acetylxylan esterase [Planctomycetota bacterium]
MSPARMQSEPRVIVTRERADLPHHLTVNPTCGYALAELLKVRAPENPPADFETFWRATYAQARAEEDRLDVARRLASQTIDGVRVSEMEYTSWDKVRVGGWLVEPPPGTPLRGLLVVGHGYGGRESPEYGWSREGFAALYPCARGFHRSARPDIPNVGTRHVVHGISSRETYVLRGCVAELWHAASILIRLYPALEERLYYVGGSFGGGLGALMLPWDARFKRAHLGVPTFGHHPLRLRWPCTGSGEGVRHYAASHPEVIEVLRYYDSATAAESVRIPTQTHAALFDPVVIPPGQFAVANSLRAPGSEIVVIPSAHFDPQPPVLTQQENERLNRGMIEFIKDA